MENSLLSYQQAAQMIGVPIGTVYAWVSQKQIPHVRLGGRLVRFYPDEIRKWLSERRIEPAKAGVSTVEKVKCRKRNSA
mgnify:CR=1 FL=1